MLNKQEVWKYYVTWSLTLKIHRTLENEMQGNVRTKESEGIYRTLTSREKCEN